MKINQKGFSVVEVLIVIVVIGLVGAIGWTVYARQDNDQDKQTPTPTSSQNEEADQATETADPYEGWQTYTNSQLGYSFKYPDSWTVTPINYGDKLGAIQIDSNDIETEDLPIGATDVISGSRVTLSTQASGDYATFTGLQKQLRDNGTIKPVESTAGGHKAIEYAFAYEGPETTYVRIAMGDSQYIETSFISEADESAHPNYDLYKKILESIE